MVLFVRFMGVGGKNRYDPTLDPICYLGTFPILKFIASFAVPQLSQFLSSPELSRSPSPGKPLGSGHPHSWGEGIKAPLKVPAASEAVLRDAVRWAPARRLADMPGQDGLLGSPAGGRGRQAPTAAPPEWLRPGSEDVYSG